MRIQGFGPSRTTLTAPASGRLRARDLQRVAAARCGVQVGDTLVGLDRKRLIVLSRRISRARLLRVNFHSNGVAGAPRRRARCSSPGRPTGRTAAIPVCSSHLPKTCPGGHPGSVVLVLNPHGPAGRRVVYPCAGLLAEGRPTAPGALRRLIGPARATLLSLLDAQLVRRRRAGRSVLYYRTPAGDRLIRAATDNGTDTDTPPG